MVVSTHSSQIAHECEFDSLRYFRRLPGGEKAIPTSCVVNLENVFGAELDTKRNEATPAKWRRSWNAATAR